MVYLDANATEPLRPAARAATLAALDKVGNPASVHAPGRAARKLVEDARESLAERFGGSPADLVFTSGGTEADALAIHALAVHVPAVGAPGGGRRVLVGATEHDAIRAAAPGAACLPVDRDGVVDLDALAAALERGAPALVCLMLANNETGTIQPIAESASLCRRHGALLHVDAVQAAGRIPTGLAALGAHSLALSSHKLGGPPGAGALLVAAELSALTPLMRGGGQERGRRGGTPSVPSIAGFAAAAAAATGVDAARLGGWRDAIDRAARDLGAIVCGERAARLPNTTCLALPGMRADRQVIRLDLAGFAVSAGSACSSGKLAASHVLAAMGLGALAGEAIRVSLPWNTGEDDVAAFIAAYAALAADRPRAPSVAVASVAA